MEAVRSSREDPLRRLGGVSTKHRMPFATEALVVRDGRMAAQVEAENAGGIVRPMPSPSKVDTWSDAGCDQRERADYDEQPTARSLDD